MALWVLIILGLLIGGFAFDMHIEAGITSFYRKRLKAQYLARAGVEYAKMLLAKSFEESAEAPPEEGEAAELYARTENLARGGAVHLRHELGLGAFDLDIIPEQGRLNVNVLSDDDWEMILDHAGVPRDRWPELIDCFHDFIDPGDEHHLNGAESDDAFYERQGYECKNAPLDTVDELVLIKGFSPELVYGGPSPFEDDVELQGIARWLTTWGDGKVNVNAATREQLLNIDGLEEYDVDQILAGRKGLDDEEGTDDDFYESVDEVMAQIGSSDESIRGRLTVTERRFVRVISKGEVQGVRSGIWCVLQAEGARVTPLFWREEDMP